MCGILGIYNNEKSSYLTYCGLFALQHRGQESAGIVSTDGKELYTNKKRMGLVSEAFKNKSSLEKLIGNSAIGHVRYSTTGQSAELNSQPLIINYKKSDIAIAHNGNLINYEELRNQLEASGSIFTTTSDTEVLFHLMAKSKKKNLEDALVYALKKVKGAYSLVLLTKEKLIAARDPYGFRPLSIGKINGAYIVASETCAFELLEDYLGKLSEDLRDVKPGEIVTISPSGINSTLFSKKNKKAFCIFEHVYFARPNSYVFGEYVNGVRESYGRQLAMEFPVDADIIVPIPDSGNYPARGFSQVSSLPVREGLNRNHYIPRTFIEPFERLDKVRLKLTPVKKVLEGKKVVLVDDSIVRATTIKKIIEMVKRYGAKEVHVRISSPPITCPCFYGIDTPTKEELIASGKNVEEIKEFIKADSLGYLSLEGMLKCMRISKKNFCTACFNGKYPVK